MPTTLHIDNGRELRGGQWQALYLLHGLVTQGHNATLLARSDSPLLDRARTEDLDARSLSLRTLRRLARSYELVHTHDARSHAMAALASGPLVVSRRVAFPPHHSPLSRWKYSRADHYIAVSNYVKQILIRSGIADDRISVVYDGIPLPPEPDYDQRNLVVAMDSDDPGKGKAVILEAARRAKIDVHFSKNLAVDVKRAKIFVYITDSEGLGSAALLAMAAGTPVLASRVGGLPEIVIDGETGLLTPNTPEQISDKMLDMVRDPAVLARWGRNARAHIESGFTTEHMTRNTLDVYEKVLR